jgi:glutaredoxin-like protein
MIPEREQRVIQQRLVDGLAGRVRIDYFTQQPSPIVVPGREDCRFCGEVEGALRDIAALHEKVSLQVHEFAGAPKGAQRLGVKRVPCTVIRGQANRALRFYGLPGGVQFPVLVETIIMASQPVALDRSVAAKLKKLREPVQLSVFVTPVCQYSAPVAATAFRMALASAQVKAEVVEISEFPELVQRFGVTATPTTIIDGRVAVRGALDEAALAAHVLASTEPSLVLRTTDAGPYTPFDGQTIEQAAASRPPAQAAGPRIYVPGR